MPSLVYLYPRCKLYASAVAEPVLQDFLEQAAMEFCRDTWLCQETLPVTDADGSFTATATRDVVGVLRLTSNGYTIWSCWPTSADNALGGLDPATFSSTQPKHFTIDESTVKINMVPVATATQVMSVTVATAPVGGADDVPAELIGKWGDAVIAKAMERLLMVPNQAFTNAGLAAWFRDQYTGYKRDARIEVNRGLARNGAKMTGPRFAR
jgi:hypothetical protein